VISLSIADFSARKEKVAQRTEYGQTHFW